MTGSDEWGRPQGQQGHPQGQWPQEAPQSQQGHPQHPQQNPAQQGQGFGQPGLTPAGQVGNVQDPHAQHQGVPQDYAGQQQGYQQPAPQQPAPMTGAHTPGAIPQQNAYPGQQAQPYQQNPLDPQQAFNPAGDVHAPAGNAPSGLPGQQGQTDLYGNPGGYHYPQQSPDDVTAPPAGAAHGSAPATHAPQFDAYQPQAPEPLASLQTQVPNFPTQNPASEPTPQTANTQTMDFGHGLGAGDAPSAFDEQPNAPQPAQSFDQGFGYNSPTTAQSAEPYGYDMGGAYAPAPTPGVASQQWAEPQVDMTAPAGAHSAPYGDSGFDPNEYQPPQMAPDNGSLEAVSSAQDYDAHYSEEDDYDAYDEPPRGRRSIVVVGALIGAIAVGGGLAYGYKSFLGAGGGADGPAKVVRSQSSPSKVKPKDPGGRQFAHQGSKVMGRLNGSGSKAGDSSNGARKVQTYSIGRDGRLTASGGGAAAGAGGAAGGSSSASASNDFADVGVPGVSVVDAFANSATSGARRSVETVNVRPKTTSPSNTGAKKSSAKPIIIAEAKPSKAPARKQPVVKKTTAPAPPKSPARLGARAGTQTAARTTPKVTPRSSGSATRNGYVAVLASVPVSSQSRVKALSQFATLQQKYAAVLSDKRPDVVEANLGERGRYHRLLVGPPGSRTAASRICSKLKSAGYSGCWVTAY